MKKTILMSMAIMMLAASAYAADLNKTYYTDPLPGSGASICIEKVTNWRVSNYDPEVNVPKVTAIEARNGGYDENNVPEK